jgi:nicotinamide riboside kinase
MKKIAVFGTHGSAKTTFVYKLAAFFKMRDKNVTVIHETARQSPFPINTNVVYQTTLFVVTSQILKELRAEAEGFEIAISDRTPSDAFIYINHVERDNEYTQSLEKFCLQWIGQYDLLIYLEPSSGYKATDDGVRAVDPHYQELIRDDFRFLVEEIENTYQGRVRILKAESSDVFEEEKCEKLFIEILEHIHKEKVEDLASKKNLN